MLLFVLLYNIIIYKFYIFYIFYIYYIYIIINTILVGDVNRTFRKGQISFSLFFFFFSKIIVIINFNLYYSVFN